MLRNTRDRKLLAYIGKTTGKLKELVNLQTSALVEKQKLLLVMFSCGKEAQSHQDKTRLNSPADSCRKVTTTRNKEFSLTDIKSFDLIDTRVMSPLTTQEGGCYSLSIIVQQQRLQGQFMLLSTNQHTAQSSSSYLAPFSKKQHSLLWMLSLIQAAKAQRWKEGDRERCLDGRAALITRL